jgi:uncharacterized protein YprB with RNaseH-like and TPR domain
MKKQYPKRLFFDIETSPNLVYSWNVGYKQQIDYHNIVKERAVICICWKWEGEKEVHELHWDKNQSDKKMLQEFVKVANQADEMVGHNSENFDIKWIRTRCVYHGIPMFPKYASLDTLKKARGGFRFNSNRLDYISTFLGAKGKTSTGFGLWTKVMDGDEAAMAKMIKYCKNDVKILEDVYKKLSNYIVNNVHHGALKGRPKHTCPECGEDNCTVSKRRTTASGMIKVQLQCNSCGKYHSISEATYKKMAEI